MVPEPNKRIRLADGRQLGFTEHGDTKGFPVLFFHGQPGNRLFCHPDDSIASSLGIRLICLDRPGFGLSDFQPNRTLLDWTNDVDELTNALGMEQFSVLGFSAGGPYAAACARQIPERILRTGLVSSAAPLYLPELSGNIPAQLRINYILARRSPNLLKLSFRLFWKFSRRNPESFTRMALKQSHPCDREVISQPGIYTLMLESWKENLRVDCQGYVKDVEILMNDWGFYFRDIKADVHLWQGEVDENIPHTWGQYMAKEIPNCKFSLIPNEGHFIIFTHWKEILQFLSR